MPPRFVYWTIIAGGLPTAFRATEREDLLPTFQRIKEKHPDAEMKWFARGKLWASKDEADRDREEWKARMADRDRPARPRTDGERRTRDWRPGGEHRDPRQKYKDAKKAKNLDRRQERFARKHGDDKPRVEKLDSDTPRAERPLPAAPRTDRPRTDRPRFDKPRFEKPRFDKPRFEKPPFDKPRFNKPGFDRPRADRPPGDRPPRQFDKPGSDRPRFDRPRFDKPRFDKPRSDKPRVDTPRGDRPLPASSRPPGKPSGARPTGGSRPDRPGGWKSRPPAAGSRPFRDRPPHDRDKERSREGDRDRRGPARPPRDKRRK